MLAEDGGAVSTIADVTALRAAGGLPGMTLSFSSPVDQGVLSIDRFELDTVEVSGELTPAGFVDDQGQLYNLRGALAAPVTSARPGIRMRLTGVRSPADLRVTSYALLRTYQFSRRGGRAGLRELFRVDLDTGNFDYQLEIIAFPAQNKAFSAIVDPSQMQSLKQAIDKARIPTLPARFPTNVADIPDTILMLNDAAAASESTIEGGAQLPRDVTALVQTTQTLIDDLTQIYAP